MTHADPVRIGGVKTAESILASAQEQDEPVFVMRAKDLFSVPMLYQYLEKVELHGPANLEFHDAIVDLIEEFKTWQKRNQGKVRYPD